MQNKTLTTSTSNHLPIAMSTTPTTNNNADWSSEDSCQKVRTSCRAWMNQQQQAEAPLVSIQAPDITRLAQDILARHQHPQKHQSSSSPIVIEWDEEQWHYVPSCDLSATIKMERLALYILAMDAINFCFWPTHNTSNCDSGDVSNFEYEHLAMAMAWMAQQDESEQKSHSHSVLSPTYVFSPARLTAMTVDEMTQLWDDALKNIAPTSSFTATSKSKITSLDNMTTRCQLWNEVGRVLLEKWNGSILQFLGIPIPKEGSSDPLVSTVTAPQLVDRILESFPGFRDCCPWQDNEYLYLYKRAQICVGDWNASLKLKLRDMESITTFADYRVPQLLRHVGVLEYHPDKLGNDIDEGREILKGSEEENTIRAATVVAVEDLVAELRKHQQQQRQEEKPEEQVFTAVTVDWYLWQVGERMHNEGTLKCHHKTRTTFY